MICVLIQAALSVLLSKEYDQTIGPAPSGSQTQDAQIIQRPDALAAFQSAHLLSRIGLESLAHAPQWTAQASQFSQTHAGTNCDYLDRTRVVSGSVHGLERPD